jgi:hypothetical protein
MYGVTIPVTAKTSEPNRRIAIERRGYSGPTAVVWKFAPLADGATFVTVAEAGCTDDGDELVKQVTDSTEGFTLMPALLFVATVAAAWSAGNPGNRIEAGPRRMRWRFAKPASE